MQPRQIQFAELMVDVVETAVEGELSTDVELRRHAAEKLSTVVGIDMQPDRIRVAAADLRAAAARWRALRPGDELVYEWR